MELFRAGEMLLKPPFTPFLATASYRLPKRNTATGLVARHGNGAQKSCQTSRSFTTGHVLRQQAPSLTREEKEPRSPSRDFPSTSPSRSTVNDDLSSLLDSTLDFTKGTPTASASRTSRFSSRNAQANSPPSREDANERNTAKAFPRTNLDKLLEGIGTRAKSRSNMQSQANRPEGSVAQMIDPFGYSNRQFVKPAEVEERQFMKLGPRVGRTVKVNLARNMDVGRAFRTLEVNCSRNGIKKEFNKQRFHERPGLKRKRLKSERWRKNFKNQFRATVQMVQQMRKQGW